MISFIKGILIKATPAEALVEVNGIGYTVQIPSSLYTELPAKGSEILLYTMFIVREQSHTLFGFLSTQERDLFEVLTAVSGIGPKTALNVIGHLPYDLLYKAVQNKDIARICKVPGIGKKSAERLILEVKDKLSAFSTPNPSAYAVTNSQCEQTVRDAVCALVNLGYSQTIAEKAIEKSLKSQAETVELSALIATALKNT